MAAPNLLKLYIDTQNNNLVQSDTAGDTFTLPIFTLGDVVPVQVVLLERDSDSGQTSPFTIIQHEYTVKVGMVTPGVSSTVHSSVTLTWDGTNYLYSGDLILNNTGTDSITELVTNAAPSNATCSLEVEISGSGIYSTPIQESVEIRPDGHKTGTPMTPPVTGYYTDAECDSTFVAKAGSTMTGELVLNAGLEMGNASMLVTKILNDAAVTGSGDHTLNPVSSTLVKLNGVNAACNLVGISGGEDGRHLYVYLDTTFTVTIKNEDAAATATDRIATPDGADASLASLGIAHFIYDSGKGRWILVSVNS